MIHLCNWPTGFKKNGFIVKDDYSKTNKFPKNNKVGYHKEGSDATIFAIKYNIMMIKRLKKPAIIISFTVIFTLLGVFIAFELETRKLYDSITHYFAKKKVEILIPKIQGKVPTGEFVKNQWTGDQGPFVLVAPERLSIYPFPEEAAPEIGALYKSARVRILFEKPLTDDRNAWVFIASENGEKIFGWVQEDGLAFQNDFTPLTDSDIPQFFMRKGDYTVLFTPIKNGKYRANWRSLGQGLHLKGSRVIHLHQYQDLFLAKKESADAWPDFFIKEGKDLKLENRFRKLRFDNNTIDYGSVKEIENPLKVKLKDEK